MAGKSSDGSYKLKLTGSGVSIDRQLSEPVARQIMSLVMGGVSGPSGLTSKGDLERSSEGHDDTSTPKAFMSGKRPQSDMERVTCLAYYLTHNRNTPAFKTKELTDLNTEAAEQKLSNPSATARNAVSHGYLSLAGGMKKQITTRGEAVVKALPDREGVQVALAEHPVRKPRKKRKARKAK